MQTMAALLRREWQEHVSGFAWGPLTVLGLLILITCLGVAIAGFGTTTISYSSDTNDGVNQSHEEVEITDSLSTLSRFVNYGNWSDGDLDRHMASFRLAVARPFELIYLLIAIFVLLGSLYEDRRDRSVLFWKSMPVTDTESVLSKLIATVWVAPAAVIAGIFVGQVFLMIVISGLIMVEDLGSVGRLWWHSGLLIGVVELTIGYIVQGFWALPLYAWLLAVSAAAPRVPFVWAIVVPLVPMAIERVVFQSEMISNFIFGHARFEALPRVASVGDGGAVTAGVGLSEQLSLLISGQMWLGLAIGALLLWAAVYLRHRNNDL
jgi:ABC-2 type transport system permease protein